MQLYCIKWFSTLQNELKLLNLIFRIIALLGLIFVVLIININVNDSLVSTLGQKFTMLDVPVM